MRVSRTSLAARRRAESEWVSWSEAERIVGCSEPTVQRLVESGAIVTRQAPRGVASLERASVLRAADTWRSEQERRQQDRESRANAPGRSKAPSGGDVWVPTAVAAMALGVTPNRIRQLVADGRLPATKKATKLWFRRRDVEIAAAARAFATLKGHLTSQEA